jgi:predicted esterase
MTGAHTIAVTTHGRYLVEPPQRRGVGLLVGFHGYIEAAETELERLRSIPGSDAWLLLSIQGLNRFYRGRSEDVVAGWMTRQDRELAIADNAAYVAAVIDAVIGEWQPAAPLIFSGFSQGVAMAYRAACASVRPVHGVIAAGGDVPPELDKTDLARVPAALLTRGERDDWYSTAKWTTDQARLREAGTRVHEFSFPGAHEWNADVSRVAGEFLQRFA